ncbi:hypothetical protein ABE58_03355 [Bacillus safensis]|nr:hypothetical protein [Bacillus safensis]OYN64328.1 hypothetical protein CFH85_17290 [Bacillus safensis]
MTTKYHDHVFLKRRENVIIVAENSFLKQVILSYELSDYKKPAESLLVFNLLFCTSKRLR